MVRAIGLTLTKMPKADTLRAIDDKCCWSGDIETRDAEAMVDTVTLDDGAVEVKKERQSEATGASVRCNLGGALTDDHPYLGS
jgi:hypothetical protein